MKTLVVYYSRTGNTKKVAEAVARGLGGDVDVEEIVDRKDRLGVLGYLCAAKDAMLGMAAPIGPARHDHSRYDLVVVGTPVWAFTVSAPARTYLARYGAAMRRVAFFCTMDGWGARRAFRRMAGACGKHPVAVMGLLSEEVARGGFRTTGTPEFVSKLKEEDGRTA